MKTKSNFKKEIPILVVVLLPLLFILLGNDYLNKVVEINWIQPKLIPIRTLISIFIGVSILIYGLMLFVQRIDPKKKNYEAFESSFYKIRFIVSLFMTAITGLFVASNIGIVIDELKILRISTFVLLAVIGNYLYSVKPNWFIGFRTPWTLDNENVWRKTHHFGAKIIVGFSIIGLIVSMIPQKEGISLIVFFSIIMIMVMIPIIYSYFLHKILTNK
ncbi:SdpI family protein [Carboxylicivirga linearis]|uniref:SdpI family protein n=1 Tax=Carboxylicivirga linearis TaxID=1628157 RepID=A0ABS5JWC4_9BACT|nr:SdpI family protein [Carboxylicivirga linearis]MBS2099212.1 SdpI family protein [Carboxylicivirga linearis]